MRMKICVHLLVVIILITIIAPFRAYAQSEIPNGATLVPTHDLYEIGVVSDNNLMWKRNGNRWEAYDSNNNKIKNKWIVWNNSYYLIDEYGFMKTGWLNISKNPSWLSGAYTLNIKFYFNDSGKMAIGWEKIGNGWYYFEANGVLKSDTWIMSGSRWYYLGSYSANGMMVTGWLNKNDKMYYLNPTNGDMAVGWKRINDKWYYFESSGKMSTNKWHFYNGEWYYLQNNGIMATSTINISGKMYRFNQSGRWIRNK